MKILAVNCFQFDNNYKFSTSFKGVSVDESNKKDSLLLNDDFDDISHKNLEEELQKIRKNTQKKIGNVSGFFKNRKILKIQRDEDLIVTGFLKAQQAMIKEYESIIYGLKNNMLLCQQNDMKTEEVITLQKALAVAERTIALTQERTKAIDSKKGFDSLAGYDEEKYILTDAFIKPVIQEKAGEYVSVPNAILFFGPVGNGKTSFARALAESSGCNFQQAEPKFVSLPMLDSPEKTKTQRKLFREESFYDELINIAKQSQINYKEKGIRTIVLIDEIDRYAYEGSSILPKLKRFLENCSENYHCTVFATTNNPLLLPSSITASKRMPIKVALDPPNEINTALVLNHYLKDCSYGDLDRIDLEELASEIVRVQPNSSYNNSQLKDICKKCISSGSNLSQQNLLYWINRIKPALDKEALEKYQKEKEEYMGGFC